MRDTSEVILIRTHEPNNYGAPGGASVQENLRGRVTKTYSATSTMPMGLNVTAPIMFEGEAIGTMTALYFLHNESFVDKLSEVFNAEVTVFSGKTRVATTLRTETGQRAVGTDIGDVIADIVLGQGRDYITEIDLFGTPYMAYYFPLKNTQTNENIGMLFLGFSNQFTMDAITRKIVNTILLGFGGLIVAFLFLFYMTAKISNPIKKLVGNVSDVALGNLNVNIDTSSNDEIGILSKNFAGMVNIINDLLKHINAIGHEFLVNGDIEARMDETLFQGSYRSVAESVNNLTGGIINDLVYMLNCLTKIGEGDFTADIPKLPGKRILMNQTMDTLKKNIQSVANDVNSLAANAINGNFSYKIDDSNYTNDWQIVMSNLNKVIDAVNEPMNEIESIIINLSVGDFAKRVSGDYKGNFLKMKNACNTTVSNIVSYIDEITSVLENISKNNLNQEISREYVGSFSNIKNALNSIITSLNSVIGNIASAADQVASGSRQISESSMSLSTGATEQASSIEELNATIQTINENTLQNANNAKEAETLSDNSKANATKGNDDMNRMLQSMDDIKESSNKIAQVIKVIEDIAFQTNLLALNASIEAAHAGEQGKGFAVVADEVRTLASKTQVSAKETSSLIEESINKVTIGSNIAAQTAETLKTIVSDATGVATIITSIASASNEQAQAINQILQGIHQVTEVVQSNSATSEETAAASEELASQSDMLKQMVSAFNLKR